MDKIKRFFLMLLVVPVIMAGNIPNFQGERLIYQLKFFNLSSGTMSFHITLDSTDNYILTVSAHTNKIFTPLFKIENSYESNFERTTFLPHSLNKNINQKNIKQQLSIKYDHNKNVATIGDSISWPIPDSCHSFFSMFYYLRTLNYLPGDTVKFYLDSESLPSLAMAVLSGKENISVPAGTFGAFKVNLQFRPLSNKPRPWKTDLLTNRLANPYSKITFWFSDDNRRLPLQVIFRQKRSNARMVLKHFDVQ